MTDKSTQWNGIAEDHTYSVRRPNCFLALRRVTFHSLTAKDIQFYTGIQEDVFKKLVLALKATGTRKQKGLSVGEQVLLTLMRLRLGLLCEDLARRFGVSVSAVSKVFTRVVKKLEEIMKDVVVWLPRSVLRDTMPQSFVRSGHGKTTCIFDCTEVSLQRPKKLMARAQTYSPYKGSNTMKFLTVIAPNGLIMFVSAAYGGRASDKFITRTCGVEDYLCPGDTIMADRGFKLDPHLEVQGISMNVPAFTKGGLLHDLSVMQD